MNILVIRVGNIGDVLMATPFLRKVQSVFPGSSIDFVTSPQAVPMVVRNPYIRKIFVYRKLKGFLGAIRNFLLIKTLRSRAYDKCFVLEEHAQYKEFASQASPCAVKIGFSGPADQCLDQKIDSSREHHLIENYLNLLKGSGLGQLQEDDFLMDLVVPNASQIVRDQIQGAGQYVIIHPGTTGYLPLRSWNAEGFVGIISFLQQKGFYIFITGQETHQALIDQILNSCNDSQKAKICSLVGKSLEDLLCFIKQAQVLVCSDTGVLHIARALQIPLVGLFGPSNPQFTGCAGPGEYVQIRNDFKCGPCNYSPEYRLEDKKYCLDGKPPACMRSITVEQVTEALKKILDHEKNTSY